MILYNLNIIGHETKKHIYIEKDKIKCVTDEKENLPETDNLTQLYFDDAVAFPGLINSHDHLDFNLFPQLGNKIYQNYVEWGTDIHSRNKDIIDSVLTIPKQLRTEWGIYKNILNGVTTVVNHGEYLDLKSPLISVFQNCFSLHSVRLEKFWKLKLNNPF